MLSCSSDNSLVCFTSFLPLHPSLCGRIVRVPLWLDLHSFFTVSFCVCHHVYFASDFQFASSIMFSLPDDNLYGCLSVTVCVCVPLSYLCGWFIHLSLLTNHNLDFMPLLLPLTHVKVFCCLISLFCTPTVIIFLLPVLPYYCTSTCN